MLKSITYPGMHVRRDFRRGADALKDGPRLLDEAATTILQLEPVLRHLRSG
jgi:hypothetical protein